MRRIFAFGMVLLFAPQLAAQQPSPYAGAQQREIKALSEAQVQGYLEGQGMGYAMAAELNHYPGPRHVLELAAQLELSAEQAQHTQMAFEAMQAEARALGARVVEGEAELDRLFSSGEAEPAEVQAVIGRLGEFQAQLRWTHLRAHIAMREILNEDQIAKYDQLRGYTDAAPGHDGPSHSGHHPHLQHH